MSGKITEVYPFSIDYARQNGEIDAYRESREVNWACARAIDEAIAANKYDTNHCDCKAAAKTVVDEYGPRRVEWVLACLVKQSYNDMRYSPANRDWSNRFSIPSEQVYVCNAHQTLIDSVITHMRDISAQRHRQAQVIGAWEKQRKMPGVKRMTLGHGIKPYAAKELVTADQLAERYNQALLDTIAARVKIIVSLVENAEPDKTDGRNVFGNVIMRLNSLRDELLGEKPLLSALVTHVAESRDLAELKERIPMLRREISEITGEKPSIMEQLKTKPPEESAPRKKKAPDMEIG